MKGIRPYIIACLLLLVFYIMAQFNHPKVVDWTETLKDNDTIPFGTYILHQQIQDVFPGVNMITTREPIYNVLSSEKFKNATYLIVCNRAEIDKTDYQKLTEFIAHGNNVFIAATSFGTYFKKKLKVETGFAFNEDDATRIGFVNKALSASQYAIEKNCTSNYFAAFDTTKATVIGQNDDHKSNYIKFTMGNGNLYLNTNPLMFSNYSLLQPQGVRYAETALSFVKENNNLIWDEYYSYGPEGEDNEMRVFLKYPELRWALYISLCSLLAFVLYQMKRRQRIIPVIEPLSNTSVEFANVVGQVYYEQRNNSNIAQKKIAYFLEYIRTRFYLKTNVLDDNFLNALAQKSGVQRDLLTDLIRQITLLGNSKNVTDNDLISLNQNIELFYTQTG